MVVNNNASAVLLGLAAIASGKEVIVSRGEAVEIGGGFRIPDVLRQSGAKLVDVGTTNRTYVGDFEAAITENTGARGLVSAVERALLPFEKRLPSTNIEKFPATYAIVSDPDKSIERLTRSPNEKKLTDTFDRLRVQETDFIKEYVNSNKANLANKYSITLTPSQIDIVAKYYADHILDIGNVIRKIKFYYDEIKKTELYFFKNQDINIVLEEDVIDLFIEQLITGSADTESMYKQLTQGFEHGLKLVRDKTGKNRFFITKQAIFDPEGYVASLLANEIKDELKNT